MYVSSCTGDRPGRAAPLSASLPMRDCSNWQYAVCATSEPIQLSKTTVCCFPSTAWTMVM
jgi:hypothetical protein